MSYAANDPPGRYPFSRPPRTSPLPILLIVLLGLIAAAALLYPMIRGMWNAADADQRALSEANAIYLKREAELRAGADAAARLFTKLDIAPSAFRAVVAKAGPAVVNVSNLIRSGGSIGRSRLDLEFTPAANGSGVLVRVTEDKTGYVVTNSHVVLHPQNRNRLTDRVGITFQSGRTIFVDAQEGVYVDPQVDLAVVRFDATGLDHLVVADFANSNEVQVGDWVVAIGSPFGLSQTVTTGIVSAKGRVKVLRDDSDVEMIQTDAAINPGNSGGPLLDMQGRIVGINTVIVTRSGGSEGIGFAIPSNTVKDVFEQLIKPPHKVVRGYLGVVPQDLSPGDARRVGDLLKQPVPGGAVLMHVEPGTPAARGGLRQFDIVVRIAGQQVLTAFDLRRLINQHRPGATITVDFIRLGEGAGDRLTAEQMTTDVTIDEKPSMEEAERRGGRGGRR
jgi:S1-C subfamily serine protease